MAKCKVCSHEKRETVDRLLLAGVGARSVGRRIDGLSRLDLTKHLNVCVANHIEQQEDHEEE